MACLYKPVRIGYQNQDVIEMSQIVARLWNARQLNDAPRLAVNGFQRVEFDHGITSFSTEAQASGETEKQIKQRLYPAFKKLLQRVCPGAAEIIVFNHGLRSSSVPQAWSPVGAPSTSALKAPVKEAHSDFSPAVSPLVAKKLVPHIDERQRYTLVNLWMSVDQKNPVMQTPLAFLDSETVDDEDLLDFFVHSGKNLEMTEWDGQMDAKFRTKLKVTGASHENHAWFYFPKMEKHEAVIFKQYDSSSAESQCCIHAAIELQEAGVRPLPERQSVEVRAIVVYPTPGNEAESVKQTAGCRSCTVS